MRYVYHPGTLEEHGNRPGTQNSGFPALRKPSHCFIQRETPQVKILTQEGMIEYHQIGK